MATATKRWTVEDLHGLPDDGMRREIVDGELYVTPAPSWRHGHALKALLLSLQRYLELNPVGEVMFAPADVIFDAHSVVQPDLFVAPLVSGRRPRSWDEVRRLLLIVEVISPGTARQDRIVKRRLYQREMVPEYWIIDVDAALVERWRPADERPEIVTDLLLWQPEGAASALEIELHPFFAELGQEE